MAKTRLLGAVVPVGALRGSKPSAVGEFPDLAEFALLCKKMKVKLIQLLPVNDTGLESSPYFSLTAFALHPLFLRIGDVPEAAPFKDKITALNKEFAGEARFPYPKVLRAKMALLREIYLSNETAIADKAKAGGTLAAWIDHNAWVKPYAVYRRLKEANNLYSWQDWKEHRDVTADDIAALWKDPQYRTEHLFWAWLQEALDAQFSAAAKAVADAGIMLEGDLPILMNNDSCDVWAHQNIFFQELSAGAPPDMYSPDGQNWGFPLYNWAAQEEDGYAWWKRRLAVAGKYYQAYRIDHVLGFFRIWSSSHRDYSSVLGRYVPFTPVTGGDLRKLGIDKGRVRWLSLPHIPTEELWSALRSAGNLTEADIAAAAKKVFTKALDRVGGEELWVFKRKIKGEKDIDALGLHPAIRPYLMGMWHNRLFLEYAKGKFSPTWYYRESRAYGTLSADEKRNMEELLSKRMAKSEKIWESHGKKLLSVLVESSPMLPCAEDLGAVPNCVPKVLTRLKILGLRVVRWHRRWDQDKQPYIPFEDYPELSVCTAAVHDSSTIREWWEREADQKQFANFIGASSLSKTYTPDVAKAILFKTATARSRFRVFQIQDLLHLSGKWYAADPAVERVNVPGSCNEFNWTYRLPASIGEIAKDRDLVKTVAELSKVKAAKKV